MSALPIVAPARFPDVFILPSGTTLVLRAVERTDRDRIHELFHRLSEESRYRRFLTPKRELSERELAYLSDIDHVSHEAIAAVDQRDGSFAGVVRVVRRSDWPEAADMAIRSRRRVSAHGHRQLPHGEDSGTHQGYRLRHPDRDDAPPQPSRPRSPEAVRFQPLRQRRS